MADIHCFYVSEGLLNANHAKRIGGSIWEFLWLISHETKMEGKVLNGSPITLARIAGELGESYNTAQRNLDKLSREGYIIKKRIGAGRVYSYSIAHSKKWKIHWDGVTKNGDTSVTKNGDTKAVGVTKNGERVSPKMVSGVTKNGMSNKEDRQLDIIDNRDTTCIKCNGTGLIRRMVPSDLIPGTERYDYVKCDECQRS